MFNVDPTLDRKSALLKKLAAQRASSGGGTRTANTLPMFQFARRGFSATGANPQRPWEQFVGGPGNAYDAGGPVGGPPGLGGGHPGAPSAAPIQGIGPGAGPGSGSPGTPQGGPQQGFAPSPQFGATSFDGQDTGGGMHLLDYNAVNAAPVGPSAPPWVQQALTNGVNSNALNAWLSANPWFLGH